MDELIRDLADMRANIHKKARKYEPNPGKRTLRKKASSRSIEATGGFLYGKALLERNTTKGNGNEGSRIYAQANWRGVGI